jgi:hypothetical protein
MKPTKIISISIVFALLTSCSDYSTTNDNPSNKTNNSAIIAEENLPPNNIFGIRGEEIVIRKGPGEKFDKIINQKATEIMHNTQYATVDYSCKVREDESKDGWSKIVVVVPDWLSISHKGWIESKYIIKKEEQVAETKVLRKNKIFNEVAEVRTKLSSVGIGELKQWRNDSYSWKSSSPYFSFGSASSDNGMQNSLAFYLESNNESYIETIKLVLNINNSSEKSQALLLLDKTAQKTFTSLKLKLPNGLSTAIKSGDNFTSDNPEYKVSLTLDRSKLDTWKLTIETK